MSLMNIQELMSLTGNDRQHLHSIEDALRDVLLAHTMTARTDGLDLDLIARATITLLLSLAAREAVEVSQANRSEIESRDFANLASEALTWAQKRGGSAPNILH